MSRLEAKKSLGQNFLRSARAVQEIVDCLHVLPETMIIEIGPGEGVLTEALAKKFPEHTIVAIEKDVRAYTALQESKEWAQAVVYKNTHFIEGDIIEILEKGIIETIEKVTDKKNISSYIIVGNIPYYITGLIIRKTFDQSILPTQAVFMVQKEVAIRMTVSAPDHSLLSIGVQTYGTPRIVHHVKRGSFVPAPNVDSAIVSIENISREWFTQNNISEKTFFDIAHTAFGQKRKIAATTISKKYELTKECAQELQTVLGKMRAEEITLDVWSRVYVTIGALIASSIQS